MTAATTTGNTFKPPAWITSSAALAALIAEFGRKHRLADVLILRITPELEEYFWSQPQFWRFNFRSAAWNKCRWGDGRLGGDLMRGDWGPLGPYIYRHAWAADLTWVPQTWDNESISSFLGLRMSPDDSFREKLRMPPSDFSNLDGLPRKARLELWSGVVEPALLDWATPVQVTAAQPLPVKMVNPEDLAAALRSSVQHESSLTSKRPASKDEAEREAAQFAQANPGRGQRWLFERWKADPARPRIPLKYFPVLKGTGRPPR
jgi:hypothetical protein